MTHSIHKNDIYRSWLEEDWGHSDITTNSCVSEDNVTSAQIIAKEKFILCGMMVARDVFWTCDPGLQIDVLRSDGALIEDRTPIMRITGKARSILSAERVALNILARMSGIATETKKLVDALGDSKAQLLDTRKTTPGLRAFEKYAVVTGGGRNHRFNLSDGILIKENHIRAAGGISAAVKKCKKNAPTTVKIEVETTTLDEVKQALAAGVDIIMLDNMSDETMQKAVALVDGRCKVEASGNITVERIQSVAATGVDYISCGKITHGAKSVDISLQVDLR